MKLFQLIIVPLLVLLIFVFEKKLKQQLLLKILFLGIMGGAIFFTIFPDISTPLANYLGIGRGVDLITYLSLLGLSVCCLLLYLKIISLERKFTEFVRKDALRDSKEFKQMN